MADQKPRTTLVTGTSESSPEIPAELAALAKELGIERMPDSVGGVILPAGSAQAESDAAKPESSRIVINGRPYTRSHPDAVPELDQDEMLTAAMERAVKLYQESQRPPLDPSP